MNTLFSTLFGILRLRSGPQDLPVSRVLTLAVCMIYLGEAVLTGQHIDPATGAARSTLSVLIQFVAIAALLGLRGTPERIDQTLLALAGTGALLHVVVFVFLIQADPGRNQPLLGLLWLGLLGWILAVDAHIYRHALTVKMSRGLLVAVVIWAFSYVVMEWLFR